MRLALKKKDKHAKFQTKTNSTILHKPIEALIYTFSKRLIISFFTSFCGFAGSKLGVKEVESLNRSSIPGAY
jgi:hypothetical protein